MATPAARPASLPLAVAAAVLGLEALVTVAFAVFLLAQRGSDGVTGAVVTAVAVVGYGAALLFVAWGVLGARRWSRAPAIATQLVQLPIAWGLREAPTTTYAALIALASAAVVVCLLVPSSTALFVPPEDRRPKPPAPDHDELDLR